jgi:hypothetical protein
MKSPGLAVAVSALVVLAIVLRVANLSNVDMRTPDEWTYTHQAKAWLSEGHAGLLENMADYKLNSTLWQFPPPTRIGMIRLVAAAIEWTGKSDESAGAVLSCAASIISILIFTLLGLRFFPPAVVLFALLFNAVSPMQLTVARRTWTDSLVEMLAIAMVYTACEISRGTRGRVVWYTLFAAAAGAGITIKEYMVLPCGLCALWILWVLVVDRRQWREGLIMAGLTLAAIGAAVWWLAASVGGMGDFVRVVASIPAVNAQFDYVLEYASGPGYRLLAGFFTLTPVASIFSVVGLYLAFRPPAGLSENRVVLRWIGIFVAVLVLFAAVVPHWLNLRYVSPVFGPFYLLAGLGFVRVFTACIKRFSATEGKVFAVLAVGLLLFDAGTDYARFRRVFVEDGTPDLSTKFLLDERER